MKKLSFLIVLLLFSAISIKAQVAVTTDGSSADPSAMLDIKSSDKGLLIPRMTKTEREDIISPAEGLMIYQTNSDPGFYYYNGTEWTAVSEKTSYTTWVMINEITLGADALSITFSGLNGNTDVEYRIIGQFKCVSNSTIFLRPNNDQTVNYHLTAVQSILGTVSAGNGFSNGFTVGSLQANQWSFVDGVLQAHNSRPRIFTYETIFEIVPGSNVSGTTADFRSLWRNTTDVITSLVITPNVSSFTAGTHVELWAKRTINQ